MTTFLHGVETFLLSNGPRAIQQVKSAIIGLVGTAPIHHALAPAAANRPVAVYTDRDNVQFGSAATVQGYTIPEALAGLQAQGYGTVVVVNVFDPTVHGTDVPAADLTITSGAIALTHGDVISATVKVMGGTGNALIEGTDYKIDRQTGIITVVAGGALASATKASVAYRYATPDTVSTDEVIGTLTEAGDRTGMQAWLDARSLLGFGPKILIAPGFSSSAAIQAALQTLAQQKKLRAVALCDAPVGATRDQVIEGRGTEGTLELRLADHRVYYLYPHLKVYDRVADAVKLSAYSSFLAGVIARTDSERGYWHSPSNKQIVGVTGIETPLSAAVNDDSCDVNQLNAAGVVTVFTGNGAGIRTWGNRASSFPGSSDILTFMAVQRTVDMVDESIELAALEYADGPVTDVLITAVLSDVNEFIRTLINRKALYPGSRVEYFPEDNPASELAAGHITFTKTFCPPPPCERMTFKSVLDTTLLGS